MHGSTNVSLWLWRVKPGLAPAAAASRKATNFSSEGITSVEFDRKGGVGVYRQMPDTLEQGCNVGLTACRAENHRRRGAGILRLERDSRRPIYSVAIVSSWRIEINNWDRSVANLPFSRVAGGLGERARIPATTRRRKARNRPPVVGALARYSDHVRLCACRSSERITGL